MNHKKVLVGVEARDKIIKGANFLADAVKSTLGPHGLNAALEKGNRITNDGVSIAREIAVKDEIEQRGVSILREAALKTNDEAGDGTTTSIVLAQAILKEAVRLLSNDRTFVGKKTPIEVINTINAEYKIVLEKLQEMATTVESEEELIQSALVSAEDEVLAGLIGKAQWAIGKDGVILAEEVNETISTIQMVKGVRIDNGLGASMLMNNQERQSLEADNCRIVLTNYTLDSLLPLKPIGEQLAKTGVKNLIIIARAFSPQAIKDCLANIEKGFNIYPVNAPFQDQREIFNDLQATLGGRYIHDEESNLEDIQLSDVGYVEKLVARRYDAIFTGADNEKSQERVTNRINELRQKLQGTISEFEKKLVEARIAQLQNGFAILKVGSNSETQRKYLKDKADDAVNAVRAALQEGVVPGAGAAFKDISDSLDDSYILKRPLCAVYEQIKSSVPADFVIPEWVKDPLKVLRIALEKACSVAGTLATINVSIATEIDKPRYVEEVINNQN